MKLLVLMNKNGELTLGARVQLYDNVMEDDSFESLSKLAKYDIVVRNNIHDGWLLPSNTADGIEVWTYWNRKFVDDRVEVLGEL